MLQISPEAVIVFSVGLSRPIQVFYEDCPRGFPQGSQRSFHSTFFPLYPSPSRKGNLPLISPNERERILTQDLRYIINDFCKTDSFSA